MPVLIPISTPSFNRLRLTAIFSLFIHPTSVVSSSLSLFWVFSLAFAIMSQSHCFWFVPTTVFRFHVSFETLLCVLLFAAVFGLFLAPGGLAWALSRSATAATLRGPSGFPLTGLLNVFNGSRPHRALAKLATRFNSLPLMAFSVGFTRFVISSRPETAREILHSSAFADRPLKESAYELLFHRAMGFAPYGEYWRNLRRISATHLFCPKRIAGFEGLRREIGLKMAEDIRSSIAENGEVKIKKIIHFGSLNNIMMTVFGRRYDFGETGDGFLLEAMVDEGYELLGLFNWSDHFPLLGWLDLQGVRKRSRKLVSKVSLFVGKIIEDHRKKRAEGVEASVKDFVDVLLDLEEEDKLTDSDMIAVLWEMIFRGTDTVAILLEWILARMVLHPEIQLKAQAEIDRVVGFSEVITDSHIHNLPYLQSIVKECLRMHPPGPLLSWARLAIHDVHIAGTFTVPAGTTAMVNMWAITHDPTIWPEPNQFKPERFVEQDVSLLGSDLALAPFGAGRRVCPGKTMALASVHLWLAHLLQKFTWVRSNEKEVDLTEVLQLSLEMKTPLICKAIPRSSF